MTAMAEQGPDAVDVAQLVRRAADGDRGAWERLVDQYARLIWSITGEFRLAESDAAWAIVERLAAPFWETSAESTRSPMPTD